MWQIFRYALLSVNTVIWNCSIIDKDNRICWITHNLIITTRDTVIGTSINDWFTHKSLKNYDRAAKAARAAGPNCPQYCRIVVRAGSQQVIYACTVEAIPNANGHVVMYGVNIPDKMDQLSYRQAEIIVLLKDLSPKQIAAALHIKPTTVYEQLGRASHKLGLTSLNELTTWSIRHL